ncbi:hypothetical protein N665_0422s0026 [Sinapis alba]|nr:hypothetical protein N665_0422s0026 [Sinapis alba]
MSSFSSSVASSEFLASASEKDFLNLLNDWRCFFNSFPCSFSFPNHSSVCFFNLQPHCLHSLLLFCIFLGFCFFQLSLYDR